MINFEQLKKLINKLFDYNFKITKDTKLVDLELDSLDVLELIQEIEKLIQTLPH